MFDHRADYRVSRCQHHYVFFVREEGVEFRDAEGTPLRDIRLTITSKAERFNWREAFSIRNPLTALKLEPRRKGYTILAQAYGYRDALIEVGHIESGTRKEFTITMEP